MKRQRILKPQMPKWFVQAVVVCILLPATPATALLLGLGGGLGGIVFDPTNFAENIRQAVALLQQIDRAVTQIELQRRTLAHLPETIAAEIVEAAEALTRSLQAHLENPIEHNYPIAPNGETPGWLDSVHEDWRHAERASLEQEREVNELVTQQMEDSTNNIARIIEASNGVGASSDEEPGVMAVAQAQQELLAACSSEAEKLIALRMARLDRRLHLQARRQSETVYQRARQVALTSDWLEIPPLQPIPSPFSEGVLP
ncbi:MAG: hypothetical protein ACPGXK_13945 [Phycisphaerae bacterium]